MATRKKNANGQETIASIAKRLNLSERTIAKYRSMGCNIYDDSAIKAFQASGECCSAYEQEELDIALDDQGALGIDPDEIIQYRARKVKAEAEIKEKQSLMLDIQLKQAKGDLISINAVCEAQTTIASKVKAQLKALCLSLPPKLLGVASMKDMSKIIESEFNNVLEYLAGEFNIEDDEE